jgi:Mg2+/Co2+ transporter CorC
MLNVTGTATVVNVFQKTTANGYRITDLLLKFNTNVAIDKATKQYRKDTIAAFIIGEHGHLPNKGSEINITQSSLRVSTWTDKNDGSLKSKPEIMINQWEILS